MRKIMILSLAILSLMWQLPTFASTRQEEINKQLVTDFYNELINNKNFETARAYLGSYYIQHNPRVVDGIDGIKNFVEFLKTNYPDAHSEIKRIFAEGDFVILHTHSIRSPGTRGRAIIDIFRLENGKIVEHWDVIEDVPETAVNNNGVF